MAREYMKVKEWFIDKQQNIAGSYYTYIDYVRGEDDCAKVEDGYVTVIAEILKETEKAVQVLLQTGDVVGSVKGWKTWIPKSLISR